MITSNINEPDWFSGIEFGKPRNEISHKPRLTKAVYKKIKSFENKIDKINRKMETDKKIKISVKKHIMTGTSKVYGKKAIELCNEAIHRLRTSLSSNGIIVYVR